MTGRPVLVLHDPGPLRSGAPWRAAWSATGWAGPVLAPDLPGHGDAPPPVGGDHEPAEGVFAALTALHGLEGAPPPLVVGVGVSGWAAQVLALAGRAAALVLVDGLGGPFAEPRELIGAGVRWLRAIADDPGAVAPAPPGAPDPRLAHGVPAHGSRRLAERAAAATTVPTLLVETAASPLERAEVDRLARRFGAGAEVVTAAADHPPEVAHAAVDWARRVLVTTR